MAYFGVIDTETSWVDQVMSIGTVIADAKDFRPVCCEVGGMHEDAPDELGLMRLFGHARKAYIPLSKERGLSNDR